MNCYNHSDQPAVSTCIDCGKGLCSECSNKYTFFPIIILFLLVIMRSKG